MISGRSVPSLVLKPNILSAKSVCQKWQKSPNSLIILPSTILPSTSLQGIHFTRGISLHFCECAWHNAFDYSSHHRSFLFCMNHLSQRSSLLAISRVTRVLNPSHLAKIRPGTAQDFFPQQYLINIVQSFQIPR